MELPDPKLERHLRSLHGARRPVRSRKLAAALKDAGYTGIVDVGEGMLGSGSGAGWIARGLPVLPYDGN
ncbi:MAG: hypothetical protein HC844_11045 [Tabrizicola sp.]|nr:hypothetical protein [Tabrizicola sp.]